MARRVIVYENRISSLFQPGGDAYQWNLRQARRVMGMATLMAPVRSAQLAASHGVEQNRDALGRYKSGFSITNTAPHARHVALGTGIHGPAGAPIVYARPVGPITPQRGARPTFIRSQKGQRANNWIERAAVVVLGPMLDG